MSTREVALAGESVVLHADRALFWPRESLLAIADLHLGKSQAFRAAGLALPRGGTSHDLSRLDDLVAGFGARRLLVLGDLLHGALSPDAAWFARWHTWRDAHPSLAVQAVLGNHDRAFDAGALRIESLGHGHDLGPFRFAHLPGTDAGRHRIAGHLHPVVRLRDTGLDARVPVFWLGESCTVLPAFTRFAGGYDIAPSPDDRLFACVHGSLASLPAKAFR